LKAAVPLSLFDITVELDDTLFYEFQRAFFFRLRSEQLPDDCRDAFGRLFIDISFHTR